MRGRVLVACAAALVLSLVLGVSFGTDAFSIGNALMDAASRDREAILVARVPRVVLGAIAGGGLAIVGVAFQAILRNPLAEPYVLGVSGGAALGATLVLVTGVSSLTIVGASLVPLAALAGGLASTLLVYGLARARGVTGSSSIL